MVNNRSAKRLSCDVDTPMLHGGEELRAGKRPRSIRDAKGLCARVFGRVGSVHLFERASSKWWNPQFQSMVLERQYFKNSFPQLRVRFRYGLLFVILTCLLWFTFHMLVPRASGLSTVFQAASAVLVVIMITIYGFTYSRHYKRFYLPTSVVVTFLIFVFSILFFIVEPRIISTVGAFVTSLEVVLMLYIIVPLPLYLCMIVSLTYSVLYEVTSHQHGATDIAAVKFLLHGCVHILGMHIFLICQIRERKTFLKVGESLMARQSLEKDRQLKEKMINSVMPRLLVDMIMKQEEDSRQSSKDSVFRLFVMKPMEPVSILFADICGFTKMSSNKTAVELVDLLNDLFGRFDDLCARSGCEKVATLGDCYYCVSGCPSYRDDHAQCCVNMGLSMCVAIQQFDRDRGQEVNMRVGIHTGTVLCGILGSKRFKFDVFSNDVSLANEMESSGRAGSVHISAATAGYLQGSFILEPGEKHEQTEMDTFFVVAPDPSRIPSARSQGALVASQGSLQTLAKKPQPGAPAACSSNPVGGQPKQKDDCSTRSSIEPWLRRDLHLRHIDSSEIDTDGVGSSPPDRHAPPTAAFLSSKAACLERASSLAARFSNSDTTGAAPATTNSHHKGSKVTPHGTPQPGLEQSRKSFSEGAIPAIPGSGGGGSTEGLVKKDLVTTGSGHGGKPDEFDAQKVSLNGSVPEKSPTPHVLSAIDVLNSSDSVSDRRNHAMESMISITRVEDRTDKRLADSLSAQERPLLLHRDAMRAGLLMFKEPDVETRYRAHFSEANPSLWSPAEEEEGAGPRGGPAPPPVPPDPAHDPRSAQHDPPSAPSPHQQPRNSGASSQNLIASKYSILIEVLVAVVIYALVSVVLFMCVRPPSLPWIVIFTVVTAVLMVFLTYLFYLRIRQSRLPVALTGWAYRHVLALALTELTVVAAAANVDFDSAHPENQVAVLYVLLTTILAHTNFSQVTHWLKTLVAALLAIAMVLLVNLKSYPCHPAGSSQDSPLLPPRTANISSTPVIITPPPPSPGLPSNRPLSVGGLPEYTDKFLAYDCNFRHEVIMDAILAILLVAFLNHQFESIFRMSFYGDLQAVRDIENMEAMKEQADMLLFNIIPPFVVDKLKAELKYSKNHERVAVIFASITNWDEMYEESYAKGREFLRVLNEVIGDFDDLLTRPEFGSIEKIKTIGTTYMAASGLKPETSSEGLDHVIDLMEFALGLQRKLHQFNQDMLSFAFKMKIGFNTGPVTAGVIGTTKLYFDIWGDTVNIASRMYSTGIVGKIQVPEHVKQLLEHVYDFEFRAHIDVKGIDAGMDVYLLTGRKDGTPLYRDI